MARIGIKISIQRKLIVLLLVVSIFPLCLLAMTAYNNWKENLKSNIGANLAETSRQTLSLIDRLLFFAKQDIKAWSLTEAMQDVIADDTDGRITAMLMRLKKSSTIYSGIFCITPTGKIVAASEPRTIGNSVSTEKWYKQVKDKRNLYIGGLAFDSLVHGFAINFTMPIFSVFDSEKEPAIIGYLSSRLNWSELFSITNSIHVNDKGQDETGYAVLMDQNGNVISAPGFLLAGDIEMEEEENQQQRISRTNLIALGMPSAKAATHGQNGFTIETGPHNKPVLSGYACSQGYQDFPGLGWGMLIVQDLKEAFAPIRHLRNSFLRLLAATVFIALLLAILASRHVSVPIRKLSKVANAIGAGDLTQSIEVHTNDEIGELATTFNHMGKQLKNSRDELVASLDFTDNILESLSNGVITLDIKRRITRCNAAANRIFGLKEDQGVCPTLGLLLFKQNSWVTEIIAKVETGGTVEWVLDADLILQTDQLIPVNLTVVPLCDVNQKLTGTILVFEDISEEKRVKSAMRRYMAAKVADRLLADGQDMLGGTMQNASILFSDIQGFTSLSEKLGAHETVSMLNEYFTMMGDIIFQHHGILDKYIGDAIMAVFGVPFESDEDTDNAVQTAVEMIRKLNGFNAHRERHNEKPLQIRIGINTDNVVVGNIGSLRRMDYTVMGGGVNLASRLESANKFFGTKILISDFTRQRLKKSFSLREVDRIRVKGMDSPVTVFEVLDYLSSNELAKKEAFVERFNHALKLYQLRQWTKAIEQFKTVIELRPEEKVSMAYIARCHKLIKEPPQKDWDGVWTMKEK